MTTRVLPLRPRPTHPSQHSRFIQRSVMFSLRRVCFLLLAAIALAAPSLGTANLAAQGSAQPAASPFDKLRFRELSVDREKTFA